METLELLMTTTFLTGSTTGEIWELLLLTAWMNESSIYIALYCVLLYTQSALQSFVCGGGGGGHRANQVDGDY